MNLRLLVVAGILLGVLLITKDARAERLTLSLSVPHGKTQTAVVVNMADPANARSVAHSYASPWNPCVGGIDTVVYTHASHPGGNVHGWLNENNGGRANRCYLSPAGHWYNLYAIIGGLRNSQFGDTFAFGPGIKFQLAKAWGASIDIGAEIPFVSYERCCGKAPVRGVLPDVWVGLNWQINKQTRLGVMQMWLPFGVTLRSAVINSPFDNGGIEERSMSAAHRPALALPPGPSIVLTYRF